MKNQVMKDQSDVYNMLKFSGQTRFTAFKVDLFFFKARLKIPSLLNDRSSTSRNAGIKQIDLNCDEIVHACSFDQTNPHLLFLQNSIDSSCHLEFLSFRRRIS